MEFAKLLLFLPALDPAVFLFSPLFSLFLPIPPAPCDTSVPVNVGPTVGPLAESILLAVGAKPRDCLPSVPLAQRACR